MAHLKRYGQIFNVNIEKMKNLKKIGLIAHPEVSLSRIVSPQKAVFKAFFLENHYLIFATGLTILIFLIFHKFLSKGVHVTFHAMDGPTGEPT